MPRRRSVIADVVDGLRATLDKDIADDADDIMTAHLPSHDVSVKRTRWNTWAASIWPHDGGSVTHLRADTLHELKDAVATHVASRM